MSDNLDQWQWVDEDPFEKLLRKPASAAPSATANLEQAIDLLNRNQPEEALACFERSLSLGDDRERALFGKAVSLQQLARHEESMKAYRELLQIAPASAEALGNLIAMSVERQDIAGLAEFSNLLLELEPQSKIALQGLATHAIWKRDSASAIQYCSRLVEMDPTSFEARSNLAFAKRKMRPAARALRSTA